MQAAEQLHLTSTDMSGFGLVDGVIPEPVGGAHSQPEAMADSLKEYILKTLGELKKINPDIPVIICTGLEKDYKEAWMDSLNVKGVLLKPVNMKELSRLISKTINGTGRIGKQLKEESKKHVNAY